MGAAVTGGNSGVEGLGAAGGGGFVVGRDRQRDDTAGQALVGPAGWAARTWPSGPRLDISYR